MDFESAVDLSPLVEKTYAGVVVVGARRMSFSRADSWALGRGVGTLPAPPLLSSRCRRGGSCYAPGAR